MDTLLRVDDLWVEARQPDDTFAPIVKGVNFTVERGEVLALIGESGSGKTTISLAMMGFARPGCRITAGKILLDDSDVLALDGASLRKLRGRRISYLAQSAAATFNPALTIGQQVTESAVLHSVLSQKAANKRAEELYRRLDLPDPELLGRRYPHQVSGGQLQRLMAAMALCSGPDLLLLDEPTTALDVTTQIEVLTAFKEIIHDQGTAAIYVTHDLSVVAQIADRILVLYDGEMKEVGTTDQIISHPTHDYTRRLMAANRPPPKMTPMDDEKSPDKSSPVIIEVEKVSAGYGRTITGRVPKLVLRDVSSFVTKGSVVGVIGESGCGKSTLARVIAGLLPATEGKITLHGELLAARTEDRKKSELQTVQIVFQMADVALNPRQSVEEILGRPLELFLGLKGTGKARRIRELLELVELSGDMVNRFPEQLSGGQKQRVCLARALAADPTVILCDEVTSSLDTIVGAAVIDLLKNLRGQLGLSYVFISHDLSTVADLADRIVVLYAGRVVEEGSIQEVLSPPYHPYTQLLLSSVPEMRQGWLEDVMDTREAKSGMAQVVEITETGCPFVSRCPIAIEGVCHSQPVPDRRPAGDHRIACHHDIAALPT